MRYLLLTGWFVFIGCLSFSQGQRINFDYLGPEHGLSQNSVLAVLEDHDGFIWLGTEEGLNRYDGYEFKIYKKDLNNANSLSYSIIWSLQEDNANNLWVGTRGGGLNLFHRETNQFTQFLHDPADANSLSHNIVHAIVQDNQGDIWVATEMGLNRVLHNEGTEQISFQGYFHQDHGSSTITNNYIDHLYLDREGTLWIGTHNGLNRYQDGRFTAYLQHYDSLRPNPNIIRYIFEDAKKRLWVGTKAGLFSFNRKTAQFTAHPAIPEIEVSCMVDDNQGRLWVGTEENGVYLYQIETQSFTHLKKESNQRSSLRDDWVRCILRDRTGIIWLGTYGGSINRYDPKKFKFKHFTTDPNNQNSLNDPILWEIYEDSNGIVWFGTLRGGLNRFDKKTGIFTHFTHDPNDPQSLSHNDVRTVIRDRQDRLWVATWGGGLNRVIEDPDGLRFKSYVHDPRNPNSISNNRAWVIHEDDQGILWIGTNGGVNRFDPESNSFTHFQHDPANPHSLSNNSVRTIGQDKRGNLWFGTFDGGLNRFDRESGRFYSFQAEAGNNNSLNNNFIANLYIDSQEVIWIATRSGLNKMSDIHSDQVNFSTYTEKDGLPNNVIYGILEDDYNYLWLTTNNGLSRFNKSTEEFRNFTENDGLQNKEFNWGAFFKNASGDMYVGGVNGFNVFRPEEIRKNPYVPPIYITSFNLLNQPINLETLNGKGSAVSELVFPYANQVVLTHRDYHFSFEYAALNFTHSTSNQYAYKMEGFDEEWVLVGNRRRATYTNLDAGSYRFMVKASNNDGIWNEEPAVVSVIILPPWWASWWAYLLYLTAGIGVLVGYLRYRNNIHQGLLKQQEAELRAQTAEAEAKAIAAESKVKIERIKVKERERLREQNSKDFHDELGHKLTKISMFLELAKRAEDTKDDLHMYLTKVEENTKDLSGGMRDFIWVLDPKNDTIYDLVTRLKDFGDRLFDHSPTSFRLIGLREELKDYQISSDTRRHLVLLFKEAMNNCLKYSGCANATLQIKIVEGNYTLTFCDDGIGFVLSERDQGYGLQNMKSRAQRIQHEISIETSPGKGTIIGVSGLISAE